MSISPKDRELVAKLATAWISVATMAGRVDVAFEEGVLYAQKLLETIERRIGVPKKKK